MQILFPHDFIESKIDKQLINSTKNSFFTQKFGDREDEDDIDE